MNTQIFPILDRNGALLPEANEVVWATMHFPESPTTISEYAVCAGIAKSHWRETGVKGGGRAFRYLNRELANRYGSAMMAGQMAVFGFKLFASGRNVSIRRVAALASESILRYPVKHEGINTPAPTDPDTLRSKFKKFSNVLHLWAAYQSYQEWNENILSSHKDLLQFLAHSTRMRALLDATFPDKSRRSWVPLVDSPSEVEADFSDFCLDQDLATIADAYTTSTGGG